MPKEEKVELLFLKNPCRRGYEASGDSHRDGDALPDSKETPLERFSNDDNLSFYIGGEDPVVEPPGFHGPNVWPNLPEEKFHGPVWDYYAETTKLSRTIWEILLQGLGSAILGKARLRPGSLAWGRTTDFGGVTVLLQQPGKEGLEVYQEGTQEWLQIPSIEGVYAIDCGDMIQKWSGGEYKSARHRVINKGDSGRLSCATFWHGDFNATNSLNPNDPSKDTVGHLLAKRFGNQFSLPKEVLMATR
ncbi:MAG: hypothetical protein M1818_000058 [Claussenomyces sp. TS43310]|nr:MAG: hypothetical protein M1818_000058 [Claussenomyces sp. TS43310]